jgi:hypothetical protein
VAQEAMTTRAEMATPVEGGTLLVVAVGDRHIITARRSGCYLRAKSSNRSCKNFPPGFFTCIQSDLSVKGRPLRDVA